jgi:hypothetical protein
MYYPERNDDYGYGGYGGPVYSVASHSPSYSVTTMREGAPGPVPQSAVDSPHRIGGSAPKVVQIRKTFPETWMFDTLDFNST